MRLRVPRPPTHGPWPLPSHGARICSFRCLVMIGYQDIHCLLGNLRVRGSAHASPLLSRGCMLRATQTSTPCTQANDPGGCLPGAGGCRCNAVLHPAAHSSLCRTQERRQRVSRLPGAMATGHGRAACWSPAVYRRGPGRPCDGQQASRREAHWLARTGPRGYVAVRWIA